MQQRLLTDDEINDARAMVGWLFWAGPIIFGVASLGLGVFALGGNLAIVLLFLVMSSLAVVLWTARIRDYNKVASDIEKRVVEVVEGAPEKVWTPRAMTHLTKLGFCYLRIAGRTIRVPNDLYGELREANMVKIAFLPTALIAARVEAVRGMGAALG